MSLPLSVVRSFLVAAAVIGASLVSAAPDALAQCRNGWCKAACTNNGKCSYVKVLSRNYPYVIYMDNSLMGMFKAQADCQQFKRRLLEVDGDPLSADWKEMMPGSMGEGIVETACNM